MKIAILTEAGFEIREEEIPSIAADQVLIKTSACGICSGDLFVYKNREALAATHGRLGHEASGEIVAVGSNVSDLKVGEIVVALGMPAYADFFVTEAYRVVPLPAEVDPDLALGEAIACCVHAAGRFGTQPGDRVAVLGCGFMGLMCLQLARLQGAGHIVAVDPVAERRAMALRLGAEAAIDPLEVDGAALAQQFGEFDIVLEAAGSQSAVDLATVLVTQHGRIVLIGYHQSNDGRRTVNMERWNFKGIEVINAHVRRQHEKVAAMREGMALLRDGKIVTAPLVTFYDFADIEAAFADLAGGKAGVFKVVLRMPET